MTGYYWTSHTLIFRDVPAEVLDEWADAVVDILSAADVRDVSVGGSLAAGRVEFEFCVPAPHPDQAMALATTRMRSAIAAVNRREHDALPLTAESVHVRRDPVALSA